MNLFKATPASARAYKCLPRLIDGDIWFIFSLFTLTMHHEEPHAPGDNKILK